MLAAHDRSFRTGMVAVVQSFGDQINLHPTSMRSSLLSLAQRTVEGVYLSYANDLADRALVTPEQAAAIWDVDF